MVKSKSLTKTNIDKDVELQDLLVFTVAAKLPQSCPTLCDPIDSSPTGSSVPGIFQEEYWSGLPFPSPIMKVFTGGMQNGIVTLEELAMAPHSSTLAWKIP